LNLTVAGKEYADALPCPSCPGPTAADFAFFYETMLNLLGGLVTVKSVVSATEVIAPPKIRADLDSPPIRDEKRFDAIYAAVQESGVTSNNDLDALDTPQHLALVWLTDYDQAKMKPSDDALLQRYALAVFYFSTFPNVDINNVAAQEQAGRWNSNDLWLSDKGFCAWHGVSCGAHLHEGVEVTHYNANGVVLSLNLTSNNVRGTIPSELAALENLQVLDLGKNSLTGTIPKSIMKSQSISKCFGIILRLFV
jgi:hypothetical protein